LRPIIICALDTGMRKGEILKLIPADLDFKDLVINVRAFNTKIMRERQVAMSRRLARELAIIVEKLPAGTDVPVFGIMDDFKKAFYAARKIAGLPELRFHDLRHTYATRLVARHLPLAEVGRVLGHTQANTTFRYVNANVETARRAAALIDEFNEPVDQLDDAVIN
jgi:integrase